jgi:hypothetical protein
MLPTHLNCGKELPYIVPSGNSITLSTRSLILYQELIYKSTKRLFIVTYVTTDESPFSYIIRGLPTSRMSPPQHIDLVSDRTHHKSTV